MALKKKTLKAIEGHIERFKAYKKLKAVGAHGITREQLRDLIRNGWIRPMEKIDAPVTTAYLVTHAQTVNIATAPKTVQTGALNFLDRMMDRYIGKAADQLKSDVLSIVEGTLMPITDRREGNEIYQALQDPKLHSKNLRGLLKDKVENWEYRWRTIVGTELNRASNWGAMDAILHNNPAKLPQEITVFKQGNRPGHGACKHCAKFWYMDDGVTPRVYRMAELVNNGTNIGKKAKDWQPTVDSTHPNETHILHELKPGYGFINGSLEYVDLDHDEYKKQKGLKP